VADAVAVAHDRWLLIEAECLACPLGAQQVESLLALLIELTPCSALLHRGEALVDLSKEEVAAF
jgi:hypothetical protein